MHGFDVIALQMPQGWELLIVGLLVVVIAVVYVHNSRKASSGEPGDELEIGWPSNCFGCSGTAIVSKPFVGWSVPVHELGNTAPVDKRPVDARSGATR